MPRYKNELLLDMRSYSPKLITLGKNFGTARSRWKDDGTRVTEVDENISCELFTILAKDFPHDDFCSEESTETPEPISLHGEFAWVLDPVDGTNNYGRRTRMWHFLRSFA